LRATSDNAERVLDVLKDFGFGDLQIGVSDLTTPNRVIQLGRPPSLTKRGLLACRLIWMANTLASWV
jgi:hypothetical protein